MTENSTIVAISTPHGIGGIAIIRLSGASAIDIADEFFCANSKIKLKNSQHGKMNFGTFNLDGIYEKGYAVVFFSPKSFTGENVVEIQVHGGYLIAEKIINKCIKLGANMAEKGEFSKRAFVNGKATLDSLEGMIDMINAESESELKAAAAIYSGKLKEQIDDIEQKFINALSSIEASIDYPDEIEELPTKESIKNLLMEVKSKLENLLLFKNQRQILKNGVMTLIVGKPNVGKSSLLNSILGEDRAIVTDIEGTTRDIIKETFVFEDVKFQILDTAGVRNTENIIEKMGVNQAIQNINLADIIIFVLDASKPLSDSDYKILNLLKEKKYILVLNKTDQYINKEVNDLFDKFSGDKVKVSALSGKGIEELLKLMKKNSHYCETSGALLVNKRQTDSIEEVLKIINKIDYSASLDLLAFELNKCLNELGKISGKTASEEVIKNIFSKFCVGK